MRQLKGKVKETRKQKKERKLDNAQTQAKIGTVVLPALGFIAMIVSISKNDQESYLIFTIILLDCGIHLPEDKTCGFGLTI